MHAHSNWYNYIEIEIDVVRCIYIYIYILPATVIIICCRNNIKLDCLSLYYACIAHICVMCHHYRRELHRLYIQHNLCILRYVLPVDCPTAPGRNIEIHKVFMARSRLSAKGGRQEKKSYFKCISNTMLKARNTHTARWVLIIRTTPSLSRITTFWFNSVV